MTLWEGQISKINCTATRIRPVVTIKWYLTNDGGQDTEITEGVSQTATTNPSNSETFDVASTFLYDASRETNGYTLKCMMAGKRTATSREDTATFNVLCKFAIKLCNIDLADIYLRGIIIMQKIRFM